jgi:hypothetical protein
MDTSTEHHKLLSLCPLQWKDLLRKISFTLLCELQLSHGTNVLLYADDVNLFRGKHAVNNSGYFPYRVVRRLVWQ